MHVSSARLLVLSTDCDLIVLGTTSRCSVMLLPSAKQSTETTAMKSSGATKQGAGKAKLTLKADAPGRLEWQQYMGGSKPSKPDGAKKVTLAVEPELLTWPYADLQIGSDMPGLLSCAFGKMFTLCFPPRNSAEAPERQHHSHMLPTTLHSSGNSCNPKGVSSPQR